MTDDDPTTGVYEICAPERLGAQFTRAKHPLCELPTPHAAHRLLVVDHREALAERILLSLGFTGLGVEYVRNSREASIHWRRGLAAADAVLDYFADLDDPLTSPG